MLIAHSTIALAHDSAGPRCDIILDEPGCITGFRAVDEESYARALGHIFELSPAARLEIQVCPRHHPNTPYLVDIVFIFFLQNL